MKNLKIEQCCVWVILSMLWTLSNNGCLASEKNSDQQKPMKDRPHSRQKRLLWITTDGRLALPPGTELTITPSLSLPFKRYPPEGFLSNMSISLPFTIAFDTLGLTDNQNPFGGYTSIFGRNMDLGLTDYVVQWMEGRRTKRSSQASSKPMHKYFQGGERALLYTMVEDLLENFGMDGKACLLRVICEVHGHSAIHKFGVIGEILHLFLSASKSMYAHLMDDYVTAETIGKDSKECYPYFKECPKSLFSNNHNYYQDNVPPEEENKSVKAEINVDDMEMSS